MNLPPALLKVRVAGAAGAADLDRVQDNIGSILNPLAANPLLSAHQFTGVALAASPAQTTIPHGLGRAWTNYSITAMNDSAIIWYPNRTNDSRFLTLESSSAVTVNVLVW